MNNYQHQPETTTEKKERKLFIAKWMIHKFDQLFPNEFACVKEVNRRRTGDTMVCYKCASKMIMKIDERTYFCPNCHKKNWFTAGTPFYGLKKIRPWFCALWLAEHGIEVNSLEFAELAGISKSTAFYIFKRVASLRANTENASNSLSILDNFIQFGESDLAQEQSKFENEPEPEQHQHNEFVQPSSNATLTAKRHEIETKLYAAITETPQDVDTLYEKVGCDLPPLLSALTMLELDGRVTRLVGDRYIRSESTLISQPRSKKIIRPTRKEKTNHPTLGSTIDSVISTSHSISKLIFNNVIQFADAAHAKFDANR